MPPRNTRTPWNDRMFMLMEYALSTKAANTQQEFFMGIGIKSVTNIYQKRDGSQSFTHAQLLAAAKKYEVDMNWFYGLSSSMFIKPESKSPIERIKSAIAELENSGTKQVARKKT